MTTGRNQAEGPDERREHTLEEVSDRTQVGYPGAKEETSWQAANHDVTRFTDELRGISDKAATAFDCRHDLGNYSSTERKEMVAAFDKSFKNIEFHGDDEAKHSLAQDVSKTIFDPIRTHVEKLEYQLSRNDSPTSYTMADHETSQAAMSYFQENFAKALEHGDPDKADATERMETLIRYSTIHFNEANLQWADHNERTNDAAREVVEAFQQHQETAPVPDEPPKLQQPIPAGRGREIQGNARAVPRRNRNDRGPDRQEGDGPHPGDHAQHQPTHRQVLTDRPDPQVDSRRRLEKRTQPFTNPK